VGSLFAMPSSDGLFFASIDAAAGTITLGWWVAAGIAALLLLFLLLAIFRAGWQDALGSIVRIGLVVVGALLAWTFLDNLSERNRADERRALDQRALELSARAMAPGSVLACLDPTLSDPVETACEKAVFATPEAVAAASAFVAAEMALLSDGAEFASRKDPSYETTLASWRRPLEADRFGFVAQLLAMRDGCTPSKCDPLNLLRDVNRVRANLADRTFDGYVTRNASAWANRMRPGAPQQPAAAPVVQLPGPGITFPSSSSIPAVSIMSNEPPTASAPPPPPVAAAPPPQPAPPPPAAAAHPPAPKRAAAPPRPRPKQTNPDAPVQIGPPPAASANQQPRAQ
jgi:hypothetical protein